MYDGVVPVGVFVLGLENETFLYGVAIDERFRGKGYGSILLQKALELGFEKDNKIVLDVDSENPAAFQLYRKYGFEIVFQVDYYIERLV